jgi:hypothetical protein
MWQLNSQAHEAKAILLAISIFERSEASPDAEAGLADTVRIWGCSLLGANRILKPSCSLAERSPIGLDFQLEEL